MRSQVDNLDTLKQQMEKRGRCRVRVSIEMQIPGARAWKRWKGSHVYVSAVEPGFIFRLVNDLAHWLIGYEQRVGPAIAVTVRQERSSADAELLRLGRVEGSELAARAARPMPDPISPDVGLVLPPFPERPKWRQDNDADGQ